VYSVSFNTWNSLPPETNFGSLSSFRQALLNIDPPKFMKCNNAVVTFARLWSSCTNRIVMHLRQLSLFSV